MGWTEYIIEHTDSKLDKVKEIIEAEQLGSKTRIHSFAHKRYYIMNYLRTETNLSQTKIGEMLGGRDHSTVFHGVQKHNQFMEWKDKVYLRDIENIRNYLEEPHTKMETTLEEDVLKANTLIELHMIQVNLRAKKYGKHST